MSRSNVVIVRIRASNAYRDAIAQRLGRERPATDDEVEAWAEGVLMQAAEDLVEAMVERRMNRK